MAKNNGMSKNLKTAIIIIVALLFLAGSIVGGILIFGNKSAELPDGERITKLATPKNLKVSDDWVLSFDSVEGAIGYYILIDGQRTKIVTEPTANLENETADVGWHTFSVRALHSLASFHSDYSEVKRVARKFVLDVPPSPSINTNALLFSWGPVSRAESYNLLFTDDKNGTETMSSSDTEYDLQQYIESHPNMKYFSVQVSASPVNRLSGNYNDCIEVSAYTDKVYYYKANTIAIPEITASGFEDGGISQKGTKRYISWVVNDGDISSEYVDHFEVWLDEQRCIAEIKSSEFDKLKTYTFDMSNYSATDVLGKKSIYVMSVPKSGIGAENKRSNLITYTVQDKLENVQNIKISKSGDYLIFDWDEVSDAIGYSLEIYGKTSAESVFLKIGDTIKGVTDTRYTFDLSSSGATYAEIYVKICADGQGEFIIASDWTESEAFTTVSQLGQVGEIQIRASETDPKVELMWDISSTDRSNIGSYTLAFYSVTYNGGTEVVADTSIRYSYSSIDGFTGNNVTVTVSDIMKQNNLEAGKYKVGVIVQPKNTNYYKSSEMSYSGVFDYKTILEAPSSCEVVCDATTRAKTLSFVGVVGASKYSVNVTDVTDSNNTTSVGSFEITQSTTYAKGEKVTDTTELTKLLSSKTKPGKYNIVIYANAPEGQTKLLNSSGYTYTYVDVFKHNAVTGLALTQDTTNKSNEWIATWNKVDTVGSETGYNYMLEKFGDDGKVVSTTTGNQKVAKTDTSATVTLNLTNAVKDNPGRYSLTVVCASMTDEYSESDRVTAEGTYYHYITVPSDIEISFAYQKASTKIRISVPHFDSLVTGYAVAFTNGATTTYKQMTLDKDNNIAYFDAWTNELPLYTNVGVSVLAGVGSITANAPDKQAYIGEIAKITKTDGFTNDYSAEGVSNITIAKNPNSEYVATLNLNANAVQYVQYVDWEILKDGRTIYEGQFSGDELKAVMNANLNTALGKDSLDTGSYMVQAVVVYNSGLESETTTSDALSVESTLASFTITQDTSDFAYIQWSPVDRAVDYEVAVTYNGTKVTDIALPWAEVTIDGNTQIRVTTTELFAKYGAGTYKFTVTAKSDTEFLKSSTAESTWVISSEIPTPTVKIYKESGVVYARILNGTLAKSYTVSVNGTEVTNAQKKSGDQYTTVALGITEAGTFLVSVVAHPSDANRSDSKAWTGEYANTITADRPSNVTVEQDGEGFSVSWDKKTYTIWSLNSNKTATSSTVNQAVKFTVSTLTGEFYADENGNAIEITANSSDTKFARGEDTTIDGLLDFLNNKKQSLYRMYFVACVDSVFVADSEMATSVDLAYRITLKTPTLSLADFSNNNLIEDGEGLAFVVSDLDSNANQYVNVKITKDNKEILVSDPIKLTNASGSNYVYTLLSKLLPSSSSGGAYKISVRASQNGSGYQESGWSKAVGFNYLKKVGEVSGIKISNSEDSKLTISFDALENVDCNYVVTMTYGDYTYTEFTQEAGKTAFTYDYSIPEDEENAQNKALAEFWTSTETPKPVLKFSITAKPTGSTSAYATTQTTAYNYSVGTVATPTNFEFTQSGDKITVTWTGDANYSASDYTTTYTVAVSYKTNGVDETTLKFDETDTTTTTSEGLIFSLPDSNTAYLITFKIISISVISNSSAGEGASEPATPVATLSGTDSAPAVTKYWVNTQETGDATAQITYDSNSTEYVIKINHTKNNGSVFSGQTYSLYINGYLIATGLKPAESGDSEYRYALNSSDASIKSVAESLMNIANISNTNVTYSVVISDATVMQDSTEFVGYSGKTCSESNLSIPVIITQQPGVILDTEKGVATWMPVTNATKYTLVIKQGDIVQETYSNIEKTDSATSVTCDFSKDWKDLNGGEYTIEVSVQDDSESNVWAMPSAKFTQTVTKKNAMKTTELSINTEGNGKGDFQTTITWGYEKEGNSSLAKDRFVITLTPVATGVDPITLDSSKIVVGQNGVTYSIKLCGRDLTSWNENTKTYNLAGEYDPTRNLPVGEYVVSMIVKGNDSLFLTDSQPCYNQTGANYVNKFGVAKIGTDGQFSDASAYSIAPECYLNGATIADGVITFASDSENKSRLSAYETAYSFNTKYFVLQESGKLRNTATNYKITFNGKEQQLIGNESCSLDVSELQSFGNKLPLRNYNIGTNEIKIMPTASAEIMDYYAYVEGTKAYTLDSDEAIGALTTTYNVDLYYKYSTPSDPRLSIQYNDTRKYNTSAVNVTFENASNDMIYSVDVMYENYYDTATTKTAEKFGTFDNLRVDSTNSKLGLALYDLISTIGPHKIWFVVRQTGADANVEVSTYCLNSDPTTTSAFTYTTSVQEFSSQEADVGKRAVSVVKAINENNDQVEYEKNGFLRWTLPSHAYSINIKYTVTLQDSNKNAEAHPVAFTTILSIKVTKDENGEIKTTYSLSDDTLFHIYNEYLYFDMTKYFLNDETVLGNDVRPSENYYLAGDYYYEIKAEALDFSENPKTAENVIYSPAKAYGFEKFTYANINYPNKPYDVTIDKNGMLTWGYVALNADKYCKEAQKFGIKVITYKLDGTTQIAEKVIEGEELSSKEYDLSSILVAGGSQCNKVWVYRVAPNSNYQNSELVSADMSAYSQNQSMPGITAEWRQPNTIAYSFDTGDGKEDDLEALGKNIKKIATELQDNGATAQYVIKIMRVDTSVAGAWENYTTLKYDDVSKKGAFTSYQFTISINPQSWLDKDNVLQLTSELDLLSGVGEQKLSGDDWISGGKLKSGVYYVKVSLEAVGHQYYTMSTAEIVHDLKPAWSVYSETGDTVSVTGEYLTTKQKSEDVASPVNSNERKWAEAENRNAYLSFKVASLKGVDGKWHLPTTVSVKLKLYNGSGYNLDNIFVKTYTLPDINTMSANDSSITLGDVTITRGTSTTDNYYTVTINIHKMFDSWTEDGEKNASDLAGVYHLDWKLDADEVGAESDSGHTDGNTWYSYEKDICHYTALQTPILDYRMDMELKGGKYCYVINWALTPNPYSYTINDIADYIVNLFAFEEQEDGTYECDAQYNALTDKSLFLQDATPSHICTTTYYNSTDGRRCYINEVSNSGLTLIPNKKYKFFIYLSPRVLSGGTSDPNSSYYLSSKTSAPREYIYKEISPAFSTASLTETQQNVYAIEGEEGFDKKEVYTLSATQFGNGINNAFELFVYDTQYKDAGTNNSWTLEQEANKTYRAHYIISTKNNVSHDEGSTYAGLYIVENYVDGVNSSITYGRQLGTLTVNGTTTTISLFKMALSDLLGDSESGKADIPITYYCKIKTWINNNEVNMNADQVNNKLQSVNVYDANWISQHITQDENEIAKYTSKLTAIETQLADFNSLNASYYFVFQHTIRFAQPTISEIQIINKTGKDDVKDANGNTVEKLTSMDGNVTSGYIKADSDGNYYFKIYLDNVYNPSAIVQADKGIKLTVSLYNYTSGELNTSGLSTKTVVFKPHYEELNGKMTSYIVIRNSKDDEFGSLESGESDMFNWIDGMLPNRLQFTATACKYSSNTTTYPEGANPGGANTSDRFILTTKSTTTKTQEIVRNFVESGVSSAVALTIRKQYTAPSIALRYDTTTSTELTDFEHGGVKSIDGNESNVLSSGEYSGMAVNPYLYVDGNTYGEAQGGANGFEYTRLSMNSSTKYRLKLTYDGREKSVEISTKDINATLTAFKKAVNGQTSWSYNANYEDTYPYEVACLYKTLYDFVNETGSGSDYHGGLVTMQLMVVAPEGDSAGYWVSSDYGYETKFAFNVRLETVQTSFDASKCLFDDGNGKQIAGYYAKNGYYYYYQTYIPFEYKTISKGAEVSYRVILTRNNSGNSLVYSYDTLSDFGAKDNAVWYATANVGEMNTGNLADMLSVDVFGADISNQNKNQWLLGGTWQINILAYADENMNNQFITRGFDSVIRTYQPKLEIVNDITSVSISMYNAETESIRDIEKDYSNIVSYNSTQQPIGSDEKGGNRAVTYVKFIYDNGGIDKAKSGEEGATRTIKISSQVTSFPQIYQKAISDFINSESFCKNSAVIGGVYKFKMQFVHGTDTSSVNKEFSLASEITDWIEFEYYKKIDERDIIVNASQVVWIGSTTTYSDTVNFTGSVAKINTISKMTVKLVQKVLNGDNSEFPTEQTLSATSDGKNWNFSGSMKFSQSRADCFSSIDYNQSDANLLTKEGYVSDTYKGSIQAGKNIFRFYPVQNTADAKYNLLPKNYYIQKEVQFIVPASLSPKVANVTHDSSPEGGAISSESETHTETGCPKIEYFTYDVECETCDGTGKAKCPGPHAGYHPQQYHYYVIKSVPCSTCNGTGQVNGEHDADGPTYTLAGKKWDCKHCGARIGAEPWDFLDHHWGSCEKHKINCTRCNGSGTVEIFESCSTCGGSGWLDDDCSTCKGSGKVEKTGEKPCTKCGGDGEYLCSKTWTHYNAYYEYISKITTRFSNSGGCSANASWSNGWKCSYSGTCTKRRFSTRNSSSNINEIKDGVTFSDSNYVNFTVTIYCKLYFESVFAKSSDTKTIRLDLSSSHYEAYDSTPKHTYISAGAQ